MDVNGAAGFLQTIILQEKAADPHHMNRLLFRLNPRLRIVYCSNTFKALVRFSARFRRVTRSVVTITTNLR